MLPQIAMSAAPVWLQAISGNSAWRRFSARMRRSKARSRSLPGSQATLTRSGSTQPYSGSVAVEGLGDHGRLDAQCVQAAHHGQRISFDAAAGAQPVVGDRQAHQALALGRRPIR
ncbi:MAG: hypothetical protein QM722_19885 [Piscinibacter sp.]